MNDDIAWIKFLKSQNKQAHNNIWYIRYKICQVKVKSKFYESNS